MRFGSVIFLPMTLILLGFTEIAVAQNGSLKLTREKRIQAFLKETKSENDIYDGSIRSPKSALFSADGSKLYINALEGYQTVVYSWPELKRLKAINHIFNSKNQHLFLNNEETVFNYSFYSDLEASKNNFKGKPVEMTLSHNGRYLWVPYYRRDYDESAQSPSAVAIVDTTSDTIVRVMPTGPIPKFVAASPDGKTMAVTHWGDNTIGLIDISSDDVKDFFYKEQLIVEKQMSQKGLEGTDRDATCGYCLRGTAFTPDSRYLLVARMGGGGLAAFDLEQNKYLGTILNVKATPRHLVITENGLNLIVSSNQSGFVTIFNLEILLNDFFKAQGKRILGEKGQELFVGKGARTIEVDPKGAYLYAAVNDGLKLVAVEMATFKIVGEATIDPYPVGLAVSRDGRHIVITSQGHSGRGGNSVNIVRVEEAQP